MKKIVLNTLILAGLTLVFSCKKDLQTYTAKPAVYFYEAGRLPAYSGEVIKDSTIFSFSLSKYQEIVQNMVVAVTGAPTNHDRSYTLKVNPASTAVAGQHYVLLTNQFKIAKGKLKDTVQIKFLRTNDMANENMLLSFDLEANNDFTTAMNYKLLANNTKHSYINYRWYVGDILVKPKRWLDVYLGTFTKKKLLLMVEVLGVDPAYMDSTMSIGEEAAYGKYMQRYLNEQEAAGNIIYEADGVTKMEMGSASK